MAKYRIIYEEGSYKIEKKTLGLWWIRITEEQLVSFNSYPDIQHFEVTFSTIEEAEGYIRNKFINCKKIIVVKEIKI